MSSDMTRQLIGLLYQRSFVKKLGLVNVNLDEQDYFKTVSTILDGQDDGDAIQASEVQALYDGAKK